MPNPQRTFTRQELADTFADIDRPDLTQGLYSRRMTLDDGGGCALAFDYDVPGDLGLVLVTVATLLGPDGGDFAAAMRLGLPGHPGMTGASGGAWWPRWTLAEPSVEEWADAVNCCLACREDDCLAHATPPWESPMLAGVA